MIGASLLGGCIDLDIRFWDLEESDDSDLDLIEESDDSGFGFDMILDFDLGVGPLDIGFRTAWANCSKVGD